MTSGLRRSFLVPLSRRLPQLSPDLPGPSSPAENMRRLRPTTWAAGVGRCPDQGPASILRVGESEQTFVRGSCR